MEVKLATSQDEVEAAQKLRYEVFYAETMTDDAKAIKATQAMKAVQVAKGTKVVKAAIAHDSKATMVHDLKATAVVHDEKVAVTHDVKTSLHNGLYHDLQNGLQSGLQNSLDNDLHHDLHHDLQNGLHNEMDTDVFDAICDHLIVVDRRSGSIIGTYRLIDTQASKMHGNFYSATEYDISLLEAYPGKILELGRACVAKPYRYHSAIKLLWTGIAQYASLFNIDLMFGCASFPGTDYMAFKHALSYLYYYHLAPANYRPKVVNASNALDMRLLPRDEVDLMTAKKTMSPLIKGYMRLGCYVGDGAFIDYEFNTIDVCIVVDMKLLQDKYLKKFPVKPQ